MHNFRALKSNLINCRRESQKIDETQVQNLTQFIVGDKLPAVALHLRAKMHSDIQAITPQHYRIGQIIRNLAKQADPQAICPKDLCCGDTEGSLDSKTMFSTERIPTESNAISIAGNQDATLTLRKSKKMLQLISDLNLLERCKKRGDNNSHIKEQIKQIKEKLAQMSISQNERESCVHLLEDTQMVNPRRAKESQKQRQSIELAQSPQQIRFKRINVSECSEEDETFTVEELTPQGYKEPPFIIHLFSAEKQTNSITPLSKISERSQESYDTQMRKQSPEQSLQYKKIFYMLETTERWKNRQGSLWGGDSQRQNFQSNKHEKKQKEKLNDKGPLKNIVNLLESKYKKKLDFDKITKNKKPQHAY